MAEDINEEDEPLEDAGSEGEEKKGLSKPLIIKIAIGVTVLILLGVGGYFFFASSDDSEMTDESMKDNGSSEIEESSDSDGGGDAVSDSIAKLMQGNKPDEMANTNDSEQAEQMKENVSDEMMDEPTSMETSESQEPADKLVKIQQETVTLQEENQQMKQKISELEALIKQKEMIIEAQDNNTPGPSFDDSMDFQQFDNSSTAAEINRVPPPEPKWGEFDRLNKK